MKHLVLALSLLLPFAARADVGTTDNVNFIVTVKENYNFKKCLAKLQDISKKQGNGYIEPLHEIKIVVINLTTLGADQAAALPCVLAVEEEGVVEGQPRSGRSS